MWIGLSFAAMGLLASMLLLVVPPGRAGVPAAVVVFYIFAVAACLTFLYLKSQGISIRMPGSAVAWVGAAALASFLGNLCFFKAMQVAPNPGYPGAIEGSKMLLVTVLSVWLFSAHFSLLKGLGALCCAIGVALMCI
jgi:uncharacterized membrane protein